MAPNLMVIIPYHAPARAATLSEALAGTTIRVQVDRRRGERRGVQQPAAVQRRRGDRRGTTRVVAYVYACPVVAVGNPSADDLLAGPQGGNFGASATLASTGPRLN